MEGGDCTLFPEVSQTGGGKLNNCSSKQTLRNKDCNNIPSEFESPG